MNTIQEHELTPIESYIEPTYLDNLSTAYKRRSYVATLIREHANEYSASSKIISDNTKDLYAKNYQLFGVPNLQLKLDPFLESIWQSAF